MSKSRIANDPEPPEQPDPADVVEEKRELFERVAAADLPISERIQRVLNHVDEEATDAE